mgnify:CR=1 FL=1
MDDPTSMTDSPITTVAPGWAIVALGILGALAVTAAVLDGALAARARGGPGGKMGGPVRPFGEAARLMRQRRRTTVEADRLLWRIGGAGLLVTAALMVTVVPLGEWTIFDLDVGVMWFNAMDVMVWALVWLTGWGANSAHSLVGGYRFLAHGLGYELPLMFALVAPAIAAETLNVGAVAAAQEGLWFAVWMPVAFLVYLLGVAAFSVWGPFAPAIGTDVAGGVHHGGAHGGSSRRCVGSPPSEPARGGVGEGGTIRVPPGPPSGAPGPARRCAPRRRAPSAAGTRPARPRPGDGSRRGRPAGARRPRSGSRARRRTP